MVSLTGTAQEMVLTVKTSIPNGLADAAIGQPAVVVGIPKCAKLKVVTAGDRTPAGMWYKDFTGSTPPELELQVK